MSVQVLTNCRLLVDQFDLSGRANKLGLSYGAKAEGPATGFGQDTENFLPGEKLFKAAHDVLYEPGTGLVDEVLFNRIALDNVLMSVCPGPTGAESEVGFFGQVSGASYKPAFAVGALAKASFDAAASNTLVRGLIAANRTSTTTSTGSILTLAGPTAAQSVYVALHVLAISGTATPTLTVTVQSAAAIGFGSPTSRIALAGQTALGAVWGTPLGPGAITDGYWRVSWTISGTNPSFTWVAIIGIQ